LSTLLFFSYMRVNLLTVSESKKQCCGPLNLHLDPHCFVQLDPDLHLECGSRFVSGTAQMTHQKQKRVKNVLFLSAVFSHLSAGGFSYYLDVLPARRTRPFLY
jgi:hypothetical protein